MNSYPKETSTHYEMSLHRRSTKISIEPADSLPDCAFLRANSPMSVSLTANLARACTSTPSVLELAEDTKLPLLERVNFLSIFASNLDEFFMVRSLASSAAHPRRIGGACGQRHEPGRPAGIAALLGPRAARPAMRRSSPTRIIPGLEQKNKEHRITTWDELSASEREVLSKWFVSQVFPVLTPPLAVEPGPTLSHTSLGCH